MRYKSEYDVFSNSDMRIHPFIAISNNIPSHNWLVVMPSFLPRTIGASIIIFNDK